MRNAAWSPPVGSDSTHRYDVTTLSVFWPESQYQAVIARWPHLTAHLGATWDEHRQRTERHCALVDREGLGVNQLPADLNPSRHSSRAEASRRPVRTICSPFRTCATSPSRWCPGRRTGRPRAGADRGASTSNAAAGTVWAHWTEGPEPSTMPAVIDFSSGLPVGIENPVSAMRPACTR
jgi:hypothetical protein